MDDIFSEPPARNRDEELDALKVYLRSVTLPKFHGAMVEQLPGLIEEMYRRFPDVSEQETADLLNEVLLPRTATLGFVLPDSTCYMAAVRQRRKECQPKKPEPITPVKVIPGLPHLTDLGNAERFIAKHAEDTRFSPALGHLNWDGISWVNDDAIAFQKSATIIKDLFIEAGKEPDESKRTALASHALKSQASNKIQAMLTIVESLPALRVDLKTFDQAPLLLTAGQSTIDLRTGESYTPRPTDYLIKRIPTSYDPAAQCPVWLRFLDQVFEGNTELIDFIRRAVGYTLTGLTHEQVMFVCYGKGRNGKSTFLNVLLALMGEYGHSMRMDTLLSQKYGSVPSDLAELHGKRLWCAIEADQGRELSESIIKQLTGQDKVNACRKYRDPFTFDPIGKLWIAVNHKPVIKGTDLAIWRRIQLIPWNMTISEDQVDQTLPGQLLEELPGILAWAVAGCRLWQFHGLNSPSLVTDATKEYRREMDVIGECLNESCEFAPNYETPFTDIYSSYCSWLGSREKPLSKMAFADELTERGYVAGHGRAKYSRKGLRLRIVSPFSEVKSASIQSNDVGQPVSTVRT